jgi:hypothetical protein
MARWFCNDLVDSATTSRFHGSTEMTLDITVPMLYNEPRLRKGRDPGRLSTLSLPLRPTFKGQPLISNHFGPAF